MPTRSPFCLAALVAMALSSTASGQLYVQAHLVGQWRIGSETITTYDQGTRTITSKHYNPAQGLGAGFTVGLPLTEQVGIEARATYVRGALFEVESINGDGTYTQTNKLEYRSNFIRIEPALRLQAGTGKARLYVAVGPSLAVAPRVEVNGTRETVYTFTGTPLLPVRENERFGTTTSGGLGLGAFGAAGVLVQGSGALGFFAELGGTAQSWSPLRTRHTYERVGTLADGSTVNTSEESEVEYVEEYTNGDAEKRPQQHLPLSSWGLRIGLHIALGKRGG